MIRDSRRLNYFSELFEPIFYLSLASPIFHDFCAPQCLRAIS
jgi:hypothetical protein